MSRRFEVALAAAWLIAGAPASATGAPADSIAADTSGVVIRADAARKRGDVSLNELLRARRPVVIARSPSFEPLLGAPTLLDAGGRVRPRPSPIYGERATDRTLVSSLFHGAGIPALAAGWEAPETEGVDPFDFVTVDSTLAPGPFRGAGDLLSGPPTALFSDLAVADPRPPRRVRSTLFYRRGDGNLLDTAARFSSPLLLHGVAGSYVRHAAEALDPLLESISTRYEAAAGLTQGPLRSWVEGRLFQMRMEVNYPGGYENSFAAEHSRAEWSSREGSLHAAWAGEKVTASGVVRVGKGQATQIDYSGRRERWAFPEVSAEGAVSGAITENGSWSLSGEGVSRRIDYREDSVSAFRPRVGSGRIAAGIRWQRGNRGISGDVAGDARRGDATLVDARVSTWGVFGAAKFRLDAESAHERPTFVDLMTPARTDTLFTFFVPTSLVLSRSGNPALGARALRGILALGSYAPARGVDLFGFGSARHITDDFGWNASRTATGNTIVVTDVASERGDGWVFQGAGGGSALLGPLAIRGFGWARGGRHGLSPQEGSPARVGADGSLGLRAAFFQGDLPLELDLEGHATGPRHGLIEAPALVTWDVRLSADFGSAGFFGRVANVFDRAVPSAFYDVESNTGAPLPGRALSIGIVWNLLD